MSIMQDYEKARDFIGHKKYDAIEKYLDIICPQEKCDKYSEAVNRNVDLPIERQIFEQRKLEKDMGMVFLSDILYKPEEWKKFDKWYNEDYLHRKAEVLNIWESSLGDVRGNANLYVNNKLIANIIIPISYDEIEEKTGNIYDYNEEVVKSLIYDNFEKYANLPKISKCSKLLQEIYDSESDSDNDMYFIEEEDWEEDYSNRYSEKDISKLEEEIKKYGLDRVITFGDDGAKIVAWGNLEASFNDDRNLKKERNHER